MITEDRLAVILANPKVAWVTDVGQNVGLILKCHTGLFNYALEGLHQHSEIG